MKNLYLLLIAGFLSPPMLKAQQAAFTYTASPASQCEGTTVSFRNISTGTPLSLHWDLGDGRSSRETHPTVHYSTPGTRTVTLTAYYPTGVTSSSQSILIYPAPEADFTADQQTACGAYTATFTDLTPGATQRVWDFGDGTTATGNPVQHRYTSADTFNVTLTAINANGCTKTVRKEGFIKIAIPVIEITNGHVLEGCAPFNANIMAQVSSINNDAVTGYTWAFGDNTSTHTSTPAAVHTYAVAGSYDLSLSITTQQGCTATRTFPQLVQAGNMPQQVSFTVTRTGDCAGSSARLLASATNATRYRWDFGDGETYEGPENDIHHIFQTTGQAIIQMLAGNNGCYAASTSVVLNNTGPVARFSFSRHCDNRKTFSFTNTSIGSASDTYEWNFDDNTPVQSNAHPVHTYQHPGSYTVRLTVRNAAQQCVSTTYQTIHVFEADFSTGVGTVCRSSEAPYGVLQVPDMLVDNYSWRFGDGTILNTQETDIRKKLTNKGTFTDTLIITYKDAAYCNDTVVKRDHIHVIAPEAAFTTTGIACEGQPVTFRDETVPSPNIPLTGWEWDFGNGHRVHAEAPGPVTYSISGAYPVKLIVTDARNCVDSLIIPQMVRPTPVMHALSPQEKLCAGASVALQGAGDANVQWQPAYQINCTACNDPVVNPLKDTSYIATATNQYGCASSDTVRFTVVPEVHLTVSPDTAICAGMSAQLRADGAALYQWLPNHAQVARPVVMPETNTSYTVSARNDPSCPAVTATINVAVKPVPTVDAGQDQVVTTGSAVQLRGEYSPDAILFNWSPANYLQCPTCPNTISDIRQPMSYVFTATNGHGCSASDAVNVQLLCDKSVIFMPSGFSPNGDGENEVFYPRGKGVRVIKTFRIYDRKGQELFKRDNFNIDDMSAGWDGTLKGKPLPPDVFVWLIEAICDTNESFHLKGNVTLVR